MSMSAQHEKTILIADNSPIVRMQMGGILSNEYDIVEVDNGTDALEAMRELGSDRIACVLLDLHMPGNDDYEVLVRKRADPSIADIPVIIVTADSVTEAEVAALDLGASDFLVKPIEPEIMRRRVRSVVYAREAENQRLRIRMLEERAWHSDHDDLTGIFTRKAFIRETHGMLEADPDTEYLVVVWDFEKFKMLNELFSSRLGDEVLEEAARALGEAIEGRGCYCRLGDDFFAFCVPEGSVDVEQVIEQISQGVNALLASRGIGFALVIAAGVYPVDDHDADVSIMLDRAMSARASVKGAYERHVAVYDSELSDRLREEQDIVNNMESALENGEFQIVLQPVYDLATSSPASAEALVRWHRPGHGVVSPGMFIPLFEENGFITKLDQNVWEQVCRHLAWRREQGLPELPISVNLSRRSIYYPELIESIVELTKKYDVKPELFRIEVTESSYVEDSERLIDTVKQLQGYGFTILMDDFGSGYSSLISLKDLPVDILKADMMLLRDLETSDRVGSIFTAIVRMARWLGIPVIAEGAETAEQVEFLRSVGCAYTQGYYFARPMSPEEFEAHLEEHPPKAVPRARIDLSADDIDVVMGGNRPAEQLMRAMFDAHAVLEWHDGSLEIARMDDGFFDLFELERDGFSFEVDDLLRIFAEGEASRFAEACREAMGERMRAELESTCVKADGAQVPVLVSIICVSASEGDAVLLVGIRRA